MGRVCEEGERKEGTSSRGSALSFFVRVSPIQKQKNIHWYMFKMLVAGGGAHPIVFHYPHTRTITETCTTVRRITCMILWIMHITNCREKTLSYNRSDNYIHVQVKSGWCHIFYVLHTILLGNVNTGFHPNVD